MLSIKSILYLPLERNILGESMHKFLLRLTLLAVISGLLPISVQASSLPQDDSVVVFKFMARNETFWASYKGNEKEFVRLANFIHSNREMIMSKTIPVFVNGYCSSFPDLETNKRMSRTRSNHVKSFVILHHGLTESHFKTTNYTTPYRNGQTDVVTLTFRIKASDFPSVVIPADDEDVFLGESIKKETIKDSSLLVELEEVIELPATDNGNKESKFVSPPSDVPMIKIGKDDGTVLSPDVNANMIPDADRVKPKSADGGLIAPIIVIDASGTGHVKVKKQKQARIKTSREPKSDKIKPIKAEKVGATIAKVEKIKPIQESEVASPIVLGGGEVHPEKPIKIKEDKVTQANHSITSRPLEYEITSEEITKKLKESNKDIVKDDSRVTLKPLKVKKDKPLKVIPSAVDKTPKPSIAVKTDHLVDVELKTNLLYWVATSPNLEAEILFKQKWSLNLEYQFAHTDFDKGSKHFRLSNFSPEVRFYPIAGRLFVGAYYNTGEYNFKFSDYGYQGAYNGGGVTLGYKLPVTKAIGFEFSLSGGYSWSDFDQYTFEDGCNRFVRGNGKNYFGPTKAKVSLIWRIGGAKK